jgi:hypothetical protein
MSDAHAAAAAAPSSHSPSWLLPALLAPLASLTMIAALFALFHARPGERLEAFLALAIAGAFVAAVQSAALLVVDLLASAMRLRRLPGGMRAWGAGAVTPLVALWLAVLIPLPFERHFWLSLFAVTVLAALPVRLLLGPRWRAP